MRFAFGLLCLFVALGAPLHAARAVALASTANAARPVIAPHRALYTMSLASVKSRSSVVGVSGQLRFEWSDVCDGWAIQQHTKLHFVYAEGDESDAISTQISWESKDGTRYNFNARHEVDGKETERARGKAVLKADGGSARYALPEVKSMPLPPDTLFPSAHTLLILQRATEGEKFFTRHIFDGSDKEGAIDVSAFIATPKSAADLPENLKANPLLSATAWPVRLAFFKPDSETGEPDYEMDMTLLANGVVREMRIDYGDFAVLATLSELEALPKPGC